MFKTGCTIVLAEFLHLQDSFIFDEIPNNPHEFHIGIDFFQNGPHPVTPFFYSVKCV